MKKRVAKIGIVVLLLAYVASYLLCRKVYKTREDEFITLYDEDEFAKGIQAVGSRQIQRFSSVRGFFLRLSNPPAVKSGQSSEGISLSIAEPNPAGQSRLIHEKVHPSCKP